MSFASYRGLTDRECYRLPWEELILPMDDDDKTPPYGTPIFGEWFTNPDGTQQLDSPAGTKVDLVEPTPRHELRLKVFEDVGRVSGKVRRRLELVQDDFTATHSMTVTCLEGVLEFLRKTGLITETAELILKERAQRLQDDGYLAP